MTKRHAKTIARAVIRIVCSYGWDLVFDYKSKTSTSRYLTFRKAASEKTVRISDHGQPAGSSRPCPDVDIRPYEKVRPHLDVFR